MKANELKTREQAEQRALELFPDYTPRQYLSKDANKIMQISQEDKRKAYLQCAKDFNIKGATDQQSDNHPTKTVEQRALELYKGNGLVHTIARQAYIKGATDNGLRERLERSDQFLRTFARSGLLDNEATENLWKCIKLNEQTLKQYK